MREQRDWRRKSEEGGGHSVRNRETGVGKVEGVEEKSGGGEDVRESRDTVFPCYFFLFFYSMS